VVAIVGATASGTRDSLMRSDTKWGARKSSSHAATLRLRAISSRSQFPGFVGLRPHIQAKTSLSYRWTTFPMYRP
jgi:hypothetical protein